MESAAVGPAAVNVMVCVNCCGRMSHSVVESLCWSRCRRFGRGNKADKNDFCRSWFFICIVLPLSSWNHLGYSVVNLDAALFEGI